MLGLCRCVVVAAALLSGLVPDGRAADVASGGPPSGTPMRLFLLVGQSNMAGRGVVDAKDNAADPNVWTLDEAGQWKPATDPIHFDKPDRDGVGPGRTFGIALAKAWPGTAIGLIPCAVGGVSLDQWKPGGKLYAEAVRRTKLAQKQGTLAGILWHQGEADTKSAKIESYSGRLDTLTAAFRKDLAAPDCPLIVGELGVFDVQKNVNRIPFNAMIDQYPTGRQNTGLVRSNGLTSIGDNTHFDARSQRELGQRYAEAYLSLQRAVTTRPSSTETK